MFFLFEINYIFEYTKVILFNLPNYLIIKKIILATALVLTSSYAFATIGNTIEAPKQNTLDEKISIIKLDDNTVMEIKFNKILGTCYARVCKTISIDQVDGTSVEVKQCSDWQQVSCPTGPQPSNPQV